MITSDQNGLCWCCVDTHMLRSITHALLTCINAVALKQMLMQGVELDLFDPVPQEFPLATYPHAY